MPYGEGRRLRAALHSQLGQQRGHVVLHGLFRQEHPFCNLPVGQPLAHQLEHPLLLVGQGGGRIDGGVLSQSRHYPLRCERIEHRLASRDRTQRADQVGAAGLLRHVAGRACHDRAEHRLVVAIGGEHKAGGPGQRGTDLPADCDAVPVRQSHIEKRHVRPQRWHLGQGRRRGSRLTSHFYIWLAGEQVPDAPPEYFMIINQEHADLAGLPRLFTHRLLRSAPGCQVSGMVPA
jgi:hypothetical protein